MNSQQPHLQERCPTKLRTLPAKCLKFKTKSSIINFIASRRTPDRTELNLMNRKRVIQMLDLFNSKYDCKKCRKKLRYKADHIIHSKLKHTATNHQITCPECSLQFRTYFSLTSHLMTVHLNERPYGCKICHKKFHAFALLKRHCHKKHLNSDSAPSSLLSPVSLNSTSSSTRSSETTDSKFNNLYDLIDYDNSTIIPSEPSSSNTTRSCHSTVFSFSSASSSTSSTSSSSSSSLSSSTTYLPLSVNNPLSVNSETNMKYFNYINTVSKSQNNSNKMDLEPIFQYLNEERQLEKELFNERLNYLIPTFTIKTKLALSKCNLCLQDFPSNSEYLNHVWRKHLNWNSPVSSINCWTCSLNSSATRRVSFKTDELLVQHIQTHLGEEPRFRCKVCGVGFNSLPAVKSHHLTCHVYKQQNEENVEFTYGCASCDQVFPSYGHILKHFKTSQRCNSVANVPYPQIKCSQCQLEFANKTVFNFHLSQHKHLDTLNQSNNIKNSNNNKLYSIDALVNSSPDRCAKKTKLEDIASKISIKQQQSNSAFQIFQTALSSLIHLSAATSAATNTALEKPEFGLQTSGIFGANFSQLASSYSRLLSETKKAQETAATGHQPLLVQPSPLKLDFSAFGVPNLTSPDSNNNKALKSTSSMTRAPLPTNPYLNSLQQQIYLSNLSTIHNNPAAYNSSFKPFMSNAGLLPGINIGSNFMNQKLTVQT
jgi:hypothetical protein